MSEQESEYLLDYLGYEDESEYCECGAQHGTDEIDSNTCAACGKPIE